MQLYLDLVNSQCCRSIWFLFYLRVMFILNCWVNVKFMLWSGSYAKTECQVLTSHMIIHYSTAYQWVLWLSFIKIQRSDRDYQQVSSPENYRFGVQKKRKRLIISWGGWIVVCTDIFTHGKLFWYSQSLPSVWWSWGDIKVTSCLAPIVYVYHLQISFNWFIDIVLVLKRNARNSIRKENRVFISAFALQNMTLIIFIYLNGDDGNDFQNVEHCDWWTLHSSRTSSVVFFPFLITRTCFLE